MKKEEGKGGRRKRRREGEVKRVSGLTKMINPSLFFLLFLLLIIISPLTKCLFFPIQQYPSLMKNSPDPVWYLTP